MFYPISPGVHGSRRNGQENPRTPTRLLIPLDSVFVCEIALSCGL